MTEKMITLAIVGADGTILIDDTDKDLSADMQADLAEFGEPQGEACANPAAAMLQLPAVNLCVRCGKQYGALCAEGACSRYTGHALTTAQIGGYYHGSHIDGPGLRSVVRFQGCPIHCEGCYVPQTWRFGAGTEVDVDALASALLDPAFERDGVTIIGGEPFAQPAALAALVKTLRKRQPNVNICVYTGYVVEALRSVAVDDSDIADALAGIDILIDGPYVRARASEAGPYTGSGNQRVLFLTPRSPYEYRG